MLEQVESGVAGNRHLHALIIEDEPIIAMLIEDILLDAGAASIMIVATESGAVDAARERRPDFITSDVHLLLGTGPAAVQTIYQEHGMIPTVFITALPGACEPCEPPAIVMGKPFRSDRIAAHFIRMTSESTMYPARPILR